MFTTMLTIAGGILLAVLFLFLLLTEAGRNILLGLFGLGVCGACVFILYIIQ